MTTSTTTITNNNSKNNNNNHNNSSENHNKDTGRRWKLKWRKGPRRRIRPGWKRRKGRNVKNRMKGGSREEEKKEGEE